MAPISITIEAFLLSKLFSLCTTSIINNLSPSLKIYINQNQKQYSNKLHYFLMIFAGIVSYEQVIEHKVIFHLMANSAVWLILYGFSHFGEYILY